VQQQQQLGEGSALPAAAAGVDSSSSSQAAGPKWDKVQLARQQQQQQRQGPRRGFGVGEGGKPSWSLMPFGGKPQDIYMELVDAVLQVGFRGPALGFRGAAGLGSGVLLMVF
jgi:hypothetical protein